jgi:alpha-L-arabinofuranosidase
MDGPWQVGHKTAAEYGHLANETAKALRGLDPTLELVVCGSSHSNMPTYPQWEATVLEERPMTRSTTSACTCISRTTRRTRGIPRPAAEARHLHRHGRGDHRLCEGQEAVEAAGDDFLRRMERLVSRAQAPMPNGCATWDWPEAPVLLEDQYNFEDVLQVGCILNTFIRRADVVKIACIAQLVNVIAPIMTEPGGPAWRQTIYWPFLFASKPRARHGDAAGGRGADL